MLDTVWRVSGKNFDVDYFVETFKIEDRSSIFHKGEKKRLDLFHKESGFNALITDNLNSSENIEELISFIQNNKKAFVYLLNSNVSSEFDIGCTVGTTDQFTKSVTISQSLVSLLHEYNIEVCFSAYPASDDEDET